MGSLLSGLLSGHSFFCVTFDGLLLVAYGYLRSEIQLSALSVKVKIVFACLRGLGYRSVQYISFISQLKNNFEIDPEAAEKIIVKRDDFYHALEHDIKPVSKTR